MSKNTIKISKPLVMFISLAVSLLVVYTLESSRQPAQQSHDIISTTVTGKQSEG